MHAHTRTHVLRSAQCMRYISIQPQKHVRFLLCNPPLPLFLLFVLFLLFAPLSPSLSFPSFLSSPPLLTRSSPLAPFFPFSSFFFLFALLSICDAAGGFSLIAAQSDPRAGEGTGEAAPVAGAEPMSASDPSQPASRRWRQGVGRTTDRGSVCVCVCWNTASTVEEEIFYISPQL